MRFSLLEWPPSHFPSVSLEREVTRKKYVLSLENRLPEQIAEEETLFIEIQKLQQTERRFKKEREELLRTLLGIESGLPEMMSIVDDEGPLGAASDSKKRRRGTDLETPVAGTPSISIGGSGPPKRLPSVKSQAFGAIQWSSFDVSYAYQSRATDAQHCITRTEPPAQSGFATKAAHQPVYLRTFKFPYPKASVAPKAVQVITELGVSATRLVMPTRDNLATLESVMDAASTLVETKKLVDKVDQDIRVAKIRLGMHVSELPPEPSGEESAPKDQAESMPPPEPMDVDGSAGGDMDAEGEPDDERAQSVISTRSTRSRKTVRNMLSCFPQSVLIHLS